MLYKVVDFHLLDKVADFHLLDQFCRHVYLAKDEVEGRGVGHLLLRGAEHLLAHPQAPRDAVVGKVGPGGGRVELCLGLLLDVQTFKERV